MGEPSRRTNATPEDGAARRPQKRTRAQKKGKDSTRKVGWPARWYFIVPLALLVLVALAALWFYPSMKVAYHEARNERVLEAKLRAVQTYNTQLEQEIQSLETTQGVAEYARRELNLVDKGDHVVIVTRDGKPVTSPDESSRLAVLVNTDAVKKPFGSWTDFLDRLFGPE